MTSNGGTGNLGSTGLVFILDGGSFAYGGPTATTAKVFESTINNGTIEVEQPATTLTMTGAIFGSGGVTKVGPGTLLLESTLNTFSGGLAVNAGAVQVFDDRGLGLGTVTIGPLGSLTFLAGTTTSRNFAVSNGTISVAAGQLVNFDHATVAGGFLRGPGTYTAGGGTSFVGVTTFASTAILETGVASYTNFTNGGTLSINANLAGAMNGFTNEGSGSLTIGAGSQINVADFQSYGTADVDPGPSAAAATWLTNTGTSPLSFNGGSRTFIGTPQTAGQNLALVDLHGQNAVVAGGLFVNNGFVGDSTGSGRRSSPTSGSLVKGAGTFANAVITQNGGKFQAGNSPGKATFGQLMLGPGGTQNFNWQINNATGHRRAESPTRTTRSAAGACSRRSRSSTRSPGRPAPGT